MTHKMGDIRPKDGFIFQCYQKKRLKDGTVTLRACWRSPEKMAKWRVGNRAAQRAWYRRQKLQPAKA